jgi:phage shock protein B
MDGYSFTLSLIALYLVYRLIRGVMHSGSDENARSAAPSEVSETELLHELHRGLARMEKRIESLETLLADRDAADRATAGEKRP